LLRSNPRSSERDTEVLVCSNDPALLPLYLADARDRLGSLKAAVDVLRQAPADRAAWDTLRGAAHALAGNSAMMGFTATADTARAIEQLAMAVEREGLGTSDDVGLADLGFLALGRQLERMMFAEDGQTP
jgi:chemotaxis protein histidine kinase CheA